VEDLKDKTQRPYQSLCKALRLSYHSFKRWKKRRKEDQLLIQRPGPKKTLPLNVARLKEDLASLNHGQKRSQGTTAVFQVYQDSISRRDFDRLVAMARYDAKVEHRNNMRRIHWQASGIVLSMDDTEYGCDINGQKLYVHNVKDMASSYLLKPIAGAFAVGESVAANLAWNYECYGAPLFQKRDGGGNLNHSDVNDVLDYYSVLPLNSPGYYPQYNGAVEQSQNELKNTIRDKLSPFDNCPKDHFGAYVEAAGHELNHLTRRKLKNRTACQVFFDGKQRVNYNKRERRSIYDWIINKANDILNKMEDITQKAIDSAYRIAVEAWLKLNHHIIVSINGKVLPYFSG
jgi:hypothetical protein